MGEPMSPEEEASLYLDMQRNDPRKDYKGYFRPKLAVDAFWTEDLVHLRGIVAECRPDMMIADFFVDAVRDISRETGIPFAMVWPQMPYGMVGASYIPGIPGLQIDALSSEHASFWTRLRAEVRPLRALPAIIPYLRSISSMRRAAGVTYSLPILGKPDYLVLVNSFWGVETPKDLPPLLTAVGPILPDEYPVLDEALNRFYKSHQRVIYISFGTHVQLELSHIDGFLGAFSRLLASGLVDGIIWAVSHRAWPIFAQNPSLASILDSQDPSWYFTLFAPQRAVLDRPETCLFVTHGGSNSINEALFHGTRMLVLGLFFDQPLNGLRIQEAGVGLTLDKASFTENDTFNKAYRLLTDESGTIAKDVERMRRIARISSRKKHYAADLIEEMLCDGKFSSSETRGSDDRLVRTRRRPMHLQTPDARMSVWRARNWDITSMSMVALAGFVWLAYQARSHLASRSSI